MPDVRIGEVHVDVEISEEIGPLGPDVVRALVAAVIEQLRRDEGRQAERERDTAIHDRVYRPRVG